MERSRGHRAPSGLMKLLIAFILCDQMRALAIAKSERAERSPYFSMNIFQIQSGSLVLLSSCPLCHRALLGSSGLMGPRGLLWARCILARWGPLGRPKEKERKKKSERKRAKEKERKKKSERKKKRKSERKRKE
jgi:hypothetical protein